MELKLLFVVLIKSFFIVLIGSTFEIHFLYLIFLILYFGFQLFYFLGDFVDKLLHNDVLLIEIDENIEKLLVLTVIIVIAYFLLDLFESFLYLHLFLQTFLVFLIDLVILLFF